MQLRPTLGAELHPKKAAALLSPELLHVHSCTWETQLSEEEVTGRQGRAQAQEPQVRRL